MGRCRIPITDVAFIRDRVRRGLPISANRARELLTLYDDVARWRESGDARDLLYVIETMDTLQGACHECISTESAGRD